MLKLLKYEFRKNLTGILVMLGITAALEGYFLYGVYIKPEDMWHAAIAGGLLFGMTAAVSIFVFASGVISYSGELKNRSAYLIFMTPNSTRKIIASKFVYTFTLGLLATAVYVALAALDITLLLGKFSEVKETLTIIVETMVELGLHPDQFVLAGVLAFLLVMLYVLALCGMAYLAVTLSHTLCRDKGYRWLVALGLYWVLTQALGALYGLFTLPFTELVYQTPAELGPIVNAYDLQLTPTFWDVATLLVPFALTSLGMILVSLFGCAWMLDKKVSL